MYARPLKGALTLGTACMVQDGRVLLPGRGACEDEAKGRSVALYLSRDHCSSRHRHTSVGEHRGIPVKNSIRVWCSRNLGEWWKRGAARTAVGGLAGFGRWPVCLSKGLARAVFRSQQGQTGKIAILRTLAPVRCQLIQRTTTGTIVDCCSFSESTPRCIKVQSVFQCSRSGPEPMGSDWCWLALGWTRNKSTPDDRLWREDESWARCWLWGGIREREQLAGGRIQYKLLQ